MILGVVYCTQAVNGSVAEASSLNTNAPFSYGYRIRKGKKSEKKTQPCHWRKRRGLRLNNIHNHIHPHRVLHRQLRNNGC